MISDQQGLPDGLPRFRGNTHAHSTNSDGRLAPEAVAEDFRAHGYAFLCLTDHDYFTDPAGAYDTDGFIVLPAIEASVYLYADETRTALLACHHMTGILGTDEMVAAAPSRFHDGERLEPLCCFGSWDGAAAARELVARLTDRGCIAIYNHPIWSRVEPADVMGLDNIIGIEVFNYDTVNEAAEGEDTVFWDLMLRHGARLGGIAADDSHHTVDFDDVFGGWIVVATPELTRDAIVRALIEGAYYASSGPKIHQFGVDHGVAWIECDPCERIVIVAGGPIGGNVARIAPAGERLTRAEFALKGTETYIRFECVDDRGRRAWTNALR